MASSFSRSLRSIETDGRGVRPWLVAFLVVALTAWAVWMARADVPLFAASKSARLVALRAVHPIESAVDGRIVAVHAALEKDVEAGAVLVELDATDAQLALAEERARLAALEGQIETSRASVAALERALADARSAAVAERKEAALAHTSAEVTSRIADEEATRLGQLRESGGVSDFGLSKARGEAEKAKVAVESQSVSAGRLELEQRRGESDREAQIAERRRQLAESEGARVVSAAVIQRLEHDIERRIVRAPAAGSIAELSMLSPGSVVRAGDRLGMIVSSATLAVEAQFEPSDALGRVKLGQHGELALTGFPRAEYGVLSVEVERIASEARDGKIRVELALIGPQRARTPLEHGLPGDVRVEVERTTPAALVLRSVGGALGLRRDQEDG
ncbi:MAG: HlyD family secretion protein [Planctomycetota bacterium]